MKRVLLSVLVLLAAFPATASAAWYANGKPVSSEPGILWGGGLTVHLFDGEEYSCAPEMATTLATPSIMEWTSLSNGSCKGGLKGVREEQGVYLTDEPPPTVACERESPAECEKKANLYAARKLGPSVTAEKPLVFEATPLRPPQPMCQYFASQQPINLTLVIPNAPIGLGRLGYVEVPLTGKVYACETNGQKNGMFPSSFDVTNENRKWAAYEECLGFPAVCTQYPAGELPGLSGESAVTGKAKIGGANLALENWK